jgi:hypothetical protein
MTAHGALMLRCLFSGWWVGILLAQVSLLAKLLPRTTVQGILLAQVSLLAKLLPRMPVQGILVDLVFHLVLVMILPVVAIPVVTLFGLLFLLGFLTVQV